MKRGLVIGKFLPIHDGHIALINFAASQCDELIVSMSYTDQDPIAADLRFSWIKEIFKDRPAIKPAMIRDDFDNEKLPLLERTKKWSEVIRRTYPPIDVLFSSEPYGDPFAVNLGNYSHLIRSGKKNTSNIGDDDKEESVHSLGLHSVGRSSLFCEKGMYIWTRKYGKVNVGHKAC